ncbi:HD domain-containing protein [Qipengyuania marisflavi]|uniref:HD domain-containing protein n=1 Tax=Qipengyuania marisflavi TaxID=2486356 RepID=A0A5S3NXY9_9SPHN|nr:HD domain-containing protein [Qipengyuania marisflavi]TMM44974.1 HD domain-containing protein [Qipengyuania marisflavi]
MTTNSTNQLSERFDDALVYASRIHRDQRRKGADIPYVSHLLGVAAIAIENGATEDQAIAALLHDAVEDQGGAARLEDIRNRFGEEVARIVNDCTDTDIEPKPPWRARKEAYLASLPHKPTASLEVSIADKTHNAGAILADLHIHGGEVWSRFTGRKGGSLWYYRELAKTFAELIPGRASNRFIRLVEEMEEIA